MEAVTVGKMGAEVGLEVGLAAGLEVELTSKRLDD